jgi:hypothetical protein
MQRFDERRKPTFSHSIKYSSLLLIAISSWILAHASHALAAPSARDLAALAKSDLIYIATVRKDSNQSKAVPVWFIVTPDHQVLIETGPNSWKAKRIRRGSPALVWIGTSDGPAFIAKAEITTDKALQDQVIEQYPKKYLLARVGFARPTRAKIDDGKIVVIHLDPVRDLPEGFQSQPGTPAPTLDEKIKTSSPK